MPHRLSGEVQGVSDEAWERVDAFLAVRPGQSLKAPDLAEAVGIDKSSALAMLIVLYTKYEVVLNYELYHCLETPVSERAMSDGFQPTPWKCPVCKKVLQRDDVRYDVICHVVAGDTRIPRKLTLATITRPDTPWSKAPSASASRSGSSRGRTRTPSKTPRKLPSGR